MPGLTTSLTIQGHTVNMESGAQDDFQALTCQLRKWVSECFMLFPSFDGWKRHVFLILFAPDSQLDTEERSRGDDATGGTVNTTSLFGGNGV